VNVQIARLRIRTDYFRLKKGDGNQEMRSASDGMASLAVGEGQKKGVDFDAGLNNVPKTGEEEVLSMPTRIGKPKSSGASNVRDSVDEDYRSLLSLDEAAALSSTEIQSWKAKYADLTTRRRDFSGGATYAYGGVFSWSMYSAAEAKDEQGTIYTEYLMRCQWGPDWNSMQPWIVARRFREFVNLDGDIKQIMYAPQQSYTFANNGGQRAGGRSSVAAVESHAAPAVKSSVDLPELPTRFVSIFGGDNMDVGTIQSRKERLEEYMLTLVTHHPMILKSVAVDRFLGIRERIKAIRKKLAEDRGEAAEGGGGGEADTSLAESEDGAEGGTALTDFNYGKNKEEIARGNTIAPGAVAELKKDGEDEDTGPRYSTLDACTRLVESLLSSDRAAEVLVQDTASVKVLDGDDIGRLEEYIVEVAGMQRQLTTKRYLLSTRTQELLGLLNGLWPSLKRASVLSDDGVGAGVDPALVGRAMQVDEDMQLLSNNYRSVHKALILATRRANGL